MNNFKRILIVFLTLAVCMPGVYARKKKEKTGKLDNKVYTDSKYDFSITLRENWDSKTFKEKSNYRLEAEQSNPEIPQEYAQFADQMPKPTMSLYMATIDMPALAFIDSLVSETYKSDQKKEILKDVDVFEEGVTFEGLRTQKRKNIKVGDFDAVQWEGIARYKIKMGGQSMTNDVALGVVGIVKDDHLLLFLTGHFPEYFKKLFNEVIEMAMSIKW